MLAVHRLGFFPRMRISNPLAMDQGPPAIAVYSHGRPIGDHAYAKEPSPCCVGPMGGRFAPSPNIGINLQITLRVNRFYQSRPRVSY
jgi:hypothetical protein